MSWTGFATDLTLVDVVGTYQKGAPAVGDGSPGSSQAMHWFPKLVITLILGFPIGIGLLLIVGRNRTVHDDFYDRVDKMVIRPAKTEPQQVVAAPKPSQKKAPTPKKAHTSGAVASNEEPAAITDDAVPDNTPAPEGVSLEQFRQLSGKL